ncbi:MAG: response regulator [Chloroflexi bacterium]|nr:response regulator [Chloroflexota bacterium]
MAERILVVDDEPAALKLISYALRREGYEVVTAANGLEALTAVRDHEVDLAILDVMMPVMDGFELCRRLRSNPQTAALPVIFLTARAVVSDKASGFRSGADEYVTKPVLPKELVRQVRALLQRAKTANRGRLRAPGLSIAFVGAKGGVGTSTLAANAASVLAQEGRSVLLADLSPSAVSVVEAVGIGPSAGLGALLGREPLQLTPWDLEPFLVEVAGLRVLPPLTAWLPRQGLVGLLAEHLPLLADLVVLDLGGAPFCTSREALRRVDRVALVSEATPVGVQALQRGWALLGELEKTHEAEVVLVHRTRFAAVVRAPDVAQVLGHEVFSVTPAPELAEQPVRVLKPLAVAQPEGMFAIQVRELTARLARARRTVSAEGTPA